MKTNALYLFIFLPIILCAQVPLQPIKVDEFDRMEDWWDFHRDGTAAQDPKAIRIENGHLILTLQNPSAKYECNVGISDEQNIYGKGIKILRVEMRLKVLNEMKPGSRGWGFWKAAKNGKASSLAWFMEQQHPDEQKLTWKMAGSLASRKRVVQDIDFNLQDWHIYVIERDIPGKNVRYFVDGELWFQTPGVVPGERMSFHLWVDNQVYSKSNGVQRLGWQGQSALIVDYVRIYGSK